MGAVPQNSSKWETVRLIILEFLTVVSAVSVAQHVLHPRDFIGWATLDAHFVVLILLFIFTVALVPRRAGLATSGFIVFYIGARACDVAYHVNVHGVILAPFAAYFLVFALGSKQLG